MKAIIEFLEARIQEDEDRAGSGWSRLGKARWETNNYGQEHLTPIAVLAECKAKRAIVDMCERHRENRDARRSPSAHDAEDEKARQERRLQEARARVADDAIRALASIYSDHPDYQDEWELQ